MAHVEITYTLTSEHVWSGDFADLPASLRSAVTADIDDPDAIAEGIDNGITEEELSTLHAAGSGSELQSESYEVVEVDVA